MDSQVRSRHDAADENKGKEVFDTTTNETGILRERRKVSGGFGHSYWVGVVEFPGNVTRAVWLKKLNVRVGKGSAAASTPATVCAAYSSILHGLRSCCMATSHAANQQTATATTREEQSFASLFKRLFGRKPTAAEIEYMLGGLSAGRCDKCRASQQIVFRPDGTYGYACNCTDALNAVNEFVAEKTKKG